MKKVFGILACLAVCLMTVSCGILGIGAKNGSASVSGQASGAALKSLYSQYKNDGQIDVTNLNNIVMLSQLANGIQGLKDVDDKSAFYTDFAAGLILGSDNLVTKQTANPITSTLQSLASGTDLSSIAAAGVLAAAQSQPVSQAKQTAQQTAQSAQQTTAQMANTAQGAVSEAVEVISDAKDEVSSTIEAITSIFSLFGN
jgi:hypothetical protein